MVLKFCKGCGCRFNKTRNSEEKKYCSTKCRVRHPRLMKGCRPTCKEADITIKEVTFADGKEHYRQQCNVCEASAFVKKRRFIEFTNERKAMHEISTQLDTRYGDSFCTRPEWVRLRYRVFSRYGRKCQLCGETDGKIHVDHIKPRSKYPELALEESNLQVLCEACNIGKGAWDETDWRS